jgi:hypothetical protein
MIIFFVAACASLYLVRANCFALWISSSWCVVPPYVPGLVGGTICVLSYCMIHFDIKLMSKVIMSYSIQLSSQLVLFHYNSYSVGYAILYTNWLLCEVVWLAWLQLPVVFKYRLVTALVPLASDSRILSHPCSVVGLFPSTYRYIGLTARWTLVGCTFDW